MSTKTLRGVELLDSTVSTAAMNMCRNRLKSLVKRLQKMGRLKEYDDLLKTQATKLYIENAPKLDITNRIHYLPHFAVIKDEIVLSVSR